MPNNRYDNAKATKKSSKPADFVPWKNAKKSKTTKSIERKVKKEIKKNLSTALVVSVIICLILGALVGYFGIKFLTKNDCFVMNEYSNNEIDIYIGDEETFKSYEEKGVKCVSFGKDISSEVNITYMYREDITHDAIQVDSIDTEVSGIYYVIYTTSNFKYKNIELIRNVIVLRGEE